MLQRAGLEIVGTEQVNAFIGEARRRQDHSGSLDASRPVARLLLELAQGAQLGIFALV